MRILVLSFYYPPDLCAGSFRAGALSEALVQRLNATDRLDVLTTLPNRYASFSEQAPETESRGPLNIMRFTIPVHQSGMKDQSIAFYHYARSVWRSMKGQQYDLVFATSSRLATAALGAGVARHLKAPLYLDIRDIFTDTLADLMAGRPLAMILPLLRAVERRTIASAKRVNLVSEGFRDYFLRIAPGRNFSFYPNGIDDEFIGRDFHKPAKGDQSIILYAGNIGAGQGLHCILPQAASLLGNGYRIKVVGDGGMRRQLEDGIRRLGINNLEVLDPVPRDRLLELYQQADYLFLHLNDYAAFHKVLPSKLFEYGATGKPVLAGVAGFAREFTQREIENSAVFDPCDANGMVQAIQQLPPAECENEGFVERYSRQRIMGRMASDILECAST